MKRVITGKREKIPADAPVGFAKLMEKCWAQREEERPTCEVVVSELNSITASTQLSGQGAETNNQETRSFNAFRGMGVK